MLSKLTGHVHQSWIQTSSDTSAVLFNLTTEAAISIKYRISVCVPELLVQIDKGFLLTSAHIAQFMLSVICLLRITQLLFPLNMNCATWCCVAR